jgi:predicted ATPase/DNA-binding CsgD family transcriptional regulator
MTPMVTVSDSGDVANSTPASASATRPAARLPQPLTPLVGREHEVAMVADLLRQRGLRLVTLTGPGGVGKTRIALAVASALSPEFAEEARFISFASILDPELVPATVARALGMSDMRGQEPLDQLATALGDRELLLVFDNLEHLLPAASWVADFLQACPNVRVLATSRERLRIGGEQESPVPPLSLPEPLALAPTDQFADSAAVRLFVTRAQAVDPAFALSAENGVAVAEICRRLDGLPLAIELAAARLKVLPPAALLTRLERRLPLLVGGCREAPARQQTMRDAIAWSYGLLSPEEQRLFRRLAIFVGGCTLEAAEAISGEADTGIEPKESGDRTNRTLEWVTSLADKSLLHRVENARDEPRFAMLETVREYAQERLVAHGELADLRRRHAEFFVQWAEDIGPRLQSGSRGTWLERLEADHDNLRAALAWSQEDPDRQECGLRLAGALLWFWYIHGHLAEGRRWLEDAIARAPEIGANRVWARGLYASGRLAWRQGDFSLACARLEASVALWRELGDRGELAFALSFLGLAARFQGWQATATRSLQAESVTLFREIGDQWGLAMALYNLADNFALWSANDDEADQDAADAMFGESRALFQEVGDAWGEALVLTSLGRLAILAGDYPKAQMHLERGLTILREAGDVWRCAQALSALGLLAEKRGNFGDAARHLGDAADRYRTLGHRQGLTETFGTLAQLARRLGEVELAGRLDADAVGVQSGAALICMSPSELQAAVVRLQACAEPTSALALLSPDQLEEPSLLTEREREVLRLIATGRSNADVAKELFISPRTVSTHAAHILAKIGLSSRAELIAFAHGQGLA